MVLLVRLSLAVVSSCALTACTGEPDGEVGGATSFCRVYAEGRDGPAEDAAGFADDLEELGAPPGLGRGFDVYLAYLRDQGDGSDEGLFEDQYATVLDDDTQRDFEAFLDAADGRCDAGASSDAPVDATKSRYCEVFVSDATLTDSSALAEVGTPEMLGRGDDIADEARRGFEAFVVAYADPTAAEREVFEEGDDDVMRVLVGVTDAFHADLFFLASYVLCVGGG